MQDLLHDQSKHAPAYGLLGVLFHRKGRWDDARQAFERSIALDPKRDEVLANFGLSLLEAGQSAEAMRVLGECTRINPRNLSGWMNLGLAARREGAVETAASAFGSACRLSPDTLEAWRYFVESAAYLPADAMVAIDKSLAPLALLIEQAILRQDVDTSGLGELAIALLAKNTVFAALLANPESFATRIEERVVGEVLRSRLFVSLIGNATVADVRFERLMAALRRALLMRPQPEHWLSLVCALASYCFHGEYVIAASIEEEAAVTSLVSTLCRSELSDQGAQGNQSALLWALVGCYQPLTGYAQSLGAFQQAAFPKLYEEQVSEVLAEQALAREIASLTSIDDAVSQAVQAQYEESPYPRWRHVARPHSQQSLRARLAALFPHAQAAIAAMPERPRVLIAGCGTGQHALTTACMTPHSRLLAIDLSRASLAYAARSAHELGITDIQFAQADLLAVDTLEERFDVIEAVGVLHHLRDPLTGWRSLRGLLNPGGLMRIALYSEQGRSDVVAARALIAEQGLRASAHDIKTARALLQSLPVSHPARAVVQARDFYSLSGCRDLLFHVEEHRFTITRIAEAIDALALEFVGFEWLEPGAQRAYREMFADEPSATVLRNWEAVEARYPSLFASMYQFWVRYPHQGSEHERSAEAS